MLNKLFTTMSLVKYEELLIKKIQIIFGSPKNHVELIKFGKMLTQQSTHVLLLRLAIIFKTIILSVIIPFYINSLYPITGLNLIIQIIYFILKAIWDYITINLILQFSRFANKFVKNLFQIKRPYVLNDSLENVTIKKDKSKSYSFPSNSIQNSYVYYSILFIYLVPSYLYVRLFVVGIICSIIGFIKLLRALHYPHDIVVALIIGYLIVLAYQNFILFFPFSITHFGLYKEVIIRFFINYFPQIDY
ncbi:PAP2 superfamily [seawater metagenome]|uniref:PAP2 superfamily n=1 Tax=seawater metagenome TaxID=1561972 RepID=A0A5E8CMH0_9ZZZZ